MYFVKYIWICWFGCEVYIYICKVFFLEVLLVDVEVEYFFIMLIKVIIGINELKILFVIYLSIFYVVLVIVDFLIF